MTASSNFAIPDYQRDYAWTNQQVSTLFDDIATLVRNNSNDSYFLGAIVTIPYDEKSATTSSVKLADYDISEDMVKHLVDGQQRLTTLSLLAKALENSIQNDIEEQPRRESLIFRLQSCLVGGGFHFESSEAAPRIILNGNTGNYYNKEILGIRQDVSTKGQFQGPKRIKSAFNYFEKNIIDLKNNCIKDGVYTNQIRFYTKFVSIVTDRLEFVEISCNSSANAFQVFDSLNGKGLDLTAADRIKNLFLSWANNPTSSEKWNGISGEVGESNLVKFFNCLMFYNTGSRVSKRQLPEEFTNYYKVQALENFDSFYAKIKNAADIYKSLIQKSSGNKDLDHFYLADLSILNQDQIYVPLMAAQIRYGTDVINKPEYIKFVEALINFVVRISIAQISTNIYDRLFSECIKLMKRGESLSSVTNLIRQTMYKYVKDSQFKDSFALFSTKNDAVARYYLVKIENYLRRNSGNMNMLPTYQVSSNPLTVEHIIPQSLDDLSLWCDGEEIPEEIKDDFTNQIINSLGNMAILQMDDNSSANNKAYKDKLNVYYNGSINNASCPVNTYCLIKDVVDNYKTHFSYKDVLDRASRLAEYAVKIWR